MAHGNAIEAEFDVGRHARKHITGVLRIRVTGLRMLRLRAWVATRIMLAAIAVLGCEVDMTVSYDNQEI